MQSVIIFMTHIVGHSCYLAYHINHLTQRATTHTYHNSSRKLVTSCSIMWVATESAMAEVVSEPTRRDQ